MKVSLSYDQASNTLTATDVTSGREPVGSYRLMQLVDGARKFLSPVYLGTSASWSPGSDGAYALVLQLVELTTTTGAYTILDESPAFFHLQVQQSLVREQQFYLDAVACGKDFHKVLEERRRRQKAFAAFMVCNILTADKLLREADCDC